MTERRELRRAAVSAARKAREQLAAALEAMQAGFEVAPDVRPVAERCSRVVRVLPYFLLTGNHVKKDIPRIVREARRFHRGRARVVLCPYLGYDERIAAVAADRLRGKRG